MSAVPLFVGAMLVATGASHDPELARSVIVLVHYDQTGAIGLIVNRRAGVPLSEVYPEMKPTQIFAGGPVAIGIRGLVRARSKPEDATHIFGDVYMVSTKPVLAKLAAAGLSDSSFRVYAGYTGWSTQQLKNEVAQGLWRVLPGDAAAVFDPKPEDVWPRLAIRSPKK